jgi:Ca2+:H+ antiporter
MDIDSIKSRARHAAWKRDDNNIWERYNPFGRTKTNSSFQAKELPDEEKAQAELNRPDAHRLHSTGCIDTGNGNGAHDFSGPKHASTINSSPTDTIATQGAASEYYNAGDTSQATTLNGDLENSAKGAVNKRNLTKIREDGSQNTNEKPSTDRGSSREDADDKKERLKREHDERMKKPIAVGQQIKTVLFPQWLTINWLLVAAPVGIGLNYAKVNPLAIFIVNFVAIVPLAGILSFATEEIALRVGEVLGGLLNASFG